MRDSGFAIREGLRSFLRQRTLSFAMAGSIAIALFALGAVALIAANVDFLLREWESKVELVAFLRHDVDPNQSEAVLERIRVLPQVKEATLVSGRESWMKLFSEAGDSLNLEGVSLDQILPPTIVVKLLPGKHQLPQIKQLASRIASLDGVDEVKFEEALLKRYLQFRRSVTVVAAGVNLFWLVIFGVITVNIARLASAARTNEMRTFNMLGAGNRLMRKMLATESILHGAVGAAVGTALLSGFALFLSSRLHQPVRIPFAVLSGLFLVGPLMALLAGWLTFRRSFTMAMIMLALLTFAKPAARAENLDDEVAQYQDELLHLRTELEQNKSAAANIKRQERTILGELEELEKEIDVQERKIAIAKGKISSNKSAMAEEQKQLGEYEKKLNESRRELEQWLKALCMRRMPSIVEIIYYDIPQSEITLRNQLITLLAQKEAEASSRFEEIYKRQADQEEGLRKRADLDTLYVETMHLRIQQSLEKKKQRQDLLAQLREQKSIYDAAINDLETSSRNLQQLIESSKAKSVSALASSVPFREMKGLLPWPTDGEVIAAFGRIQNPNSSTYTRHLGIDISAPAGSGIRAVHDGLVVYCDWFRGYGKLVILDHGSGYSSIYSHCSEVLVNKGEFVRAGVPLGLVGETGSLKGPCLYFELRENGQPVDPLAWLQRRM
jgi:septal ring factor EnvC (AmiA/AmiB activator)